MNPPNFLGFQMADNFMIKYNFQFYLAHAAQQTKNPLHAAHVEGFFTALCKGFLHIEGFTLR